MPQGVEHYSDLEGYQIEAAAKPLMPQGVEH